MTTDPIDRFSSREHWLRFGGGQVNGVTGCHCGFVADPDDNGYGDSVVDHIAAVATPAARVSLTQAQADTDEPGSACEDVLLEIGRGLRAVHDGDDPATVYIVIAPLVQALAAYGKPAERDRPHPFVRVDGQATCGVCGELRNKNYGQHLAQPEPAEEGNR